MKKQVKFKVVEHLKQSVIWGRDVPLLVRICKENGVYISEADAYHAWCEYSDSMAETWSQLDVEKAFSNVIQFCEEVNLDGN